MLPPACLCLCLPPSHHAAEYSDTVGYFNNTSGMFNPAKQYNFNGVDSTNGGTSLSDQNVSAREQGDSS